MTDYSAMTIDELYELIEGLDPYLGSHFDKVFKAVAPEFLRRSGARDAILDLAEELDAEGWNLTRAPPSDEEIQDCMRKIGWKG